MPTKDKSGPRCAAIVGPYLSGKTSLLESILFAAGAVNRKGTIKEGNTVSDSSPEAQKRQMSVELSVANIDYLDDQWAFIDCPGSIELSQEAMNALMVVDIAIALKVSTWDSADVLRHILVPCPSPYPSSVVPQLPACLQSTSIIDYCQVFTLQFTPTPKQINMLHYFY